MKFLVLALCVCAASAASYGARPFQQGAKAFVQITVPEAATVAPYVAYDANKKVVAVPVAAAKAISVVPAVATKAVYNNAQDVYRTKDYEAEITRYDSDVSADKFFYGYETSNGIAAEATGTAKKVDNTEAQVFEGSYRYVDPNGQTVVVNYVADENGYRPQSDVLPTSPPIPDDILRSLEWIRTHYRKEEDN